jgi:hypothetical protein
VIARPCPLGGHRTGGRQGLGQPRLHEVDERPSACREASSARVEQMQRSGRWRLLVQHGHKPSAVDSPVDQQARQAGDAQALLRRTGQHHEVFVAHQATTDRHITAADASPEGPAGAHLNAGAGEAQAGMGRQIRGALRGAVAGQVGGTGDDAVGGAVEQPIRLAIRMESLRCSARMATSKRSATRSTGRSVSCSSTSTAGKASRNSARTGARNSSSIVTAVVICSRPRGSRCSSVAAYWAASSRAIAASASSATDP